MNELRTPHMRPGGVVRTRLVFAPRWVRLLPFALVAVALAAGAAIVVGQMNDRLASAPQDDLAADRFAYRYATEQDTNDELGYGFHRPPEWDLRQQGSLSTISSPDGDIVVSFGLGSDGRLRAGADGLVTLVGETYKDVRLTGGQIKRIGADLASVRRGQATDTTGIRLRFLAVTVDAEPNNYAILAFRTSEQLSVAARETIQEVIYSFRPPVDAPG